MAPPSGNDQKPHDGNIHITYAQYFLFFLLFLLFYACYHILNPYLHTIILATILAIVSYPIHRKIEKKLNGKPNLAASISCLILTLLVIIPLFIMVFALIRQGIQSFHAISAWIAAGKFEQLLQTAPVLKLISLFNQYLPDVDIKNYKIDQVLLKTSSTIGKMLINQGGNLVGNITSLIGKFFLMIFVFFFLIRDARSIVQRVLHLIPLSASHEEQIIMKIKTVARSALLGTFVTAIAQGIAGGIAFWICGLPALFWGLVMAFASLIPIVGTALIWTPASIYLFLSGRWGYGVFLIIWCAVIVGMIDNFVRPIFMKGGAGMSTVLIFFAILGGINYYGLIGILYGPLIFGLTMVFLYIYQLEFEKFLTHQDQL